MKRSRVSTIHARLFFQASSDTNSSMSHSRSIGIRWREKPLHDSRCLHHESYLLGSAFADDGTAWLSVAEQSTAPLAGGSIECFFFRLCHDYAPLLQQASFATRSNSSSDPLLALRTLPSLTT